MKNKGEGIIRDIIFLNNHGINSAFGCHNVFKIFRTDVGTAIDEMWMSML